MRTLLLALSLLTLPALLHAQAGADRYGKCGDTRYASTTVRQFYSDLFVSPESAETRARFGIRQVADDAPMFTETNEHVCQRLMQPVRVAFRKVWSDHRNPNDRLFSFLRIGDYYLILVGYFPGDLPAGLSVRIPHIIVDAKTMEYIGHVWG